MKTSIKIAVSTYDIRENLENPIICTVKLDSNKFPYIIIDNEKLILNSVEFPRDVEYCWGLRKVKLEFYSGLLEELQSIINNENLTVDKLGMKQLVRVG